MKAENLNLYKTWAPEDSVWAAWAKPVLFASLRVAQKPNHELPQAALQNMPLDPNAMIIVDMPGAQSVAEALAFAEYGYRPVPLYNGVMGFGKMLVGVRELGEALVLGAPRLRRLPLRPGAPPVFMLDSNRMKGYQAPNTFDNRWCVFPQDMPSAQYIKGRGIAKVILCCDKSQPATDLARILYDYQKAGLALQIIGAGDSYPKPLSIKKQSFADEWAYRLKVILKLKRSAAGGFGAAIPAPYEQSGGGTYYRMG